MHSRNAFFNPFFPLLSFFSSSFQTHLASPTAETGSPPLPNSKFIPSLDDGDDEMIPFAAGHGEESDLVKQGLVDHLVAGFTIAAALLVVVTTLAISAELVGRSVLVNVEGEGGLQLSSPPSWMLESIERGWGGVEVVGTAVGIDVPTIRADWNMAPATLNAGDGAVKMEEGGDTVDVAAADGAEGVEGGEGAGEKKKKEQNGRDEQGAELSNNTQAPDAASDATAPAASCSAPENTNDGAESAAGAGAGMGGGAGTGGENTNESDDVYHDGGKSSLKGLLRKLFAVTEVAMLIDATVMVLQILMEKREDNGT